MDPCIYMHGAKQSRVQWLRAQCSRAQHFRIVISNSSLEQPLRTHRRHRSRLEQPLRAHWRHRAGSNSLFERLFEPLCALATPNQAQTAYLSTLAAANQTQAARAAFLSALAAPGQGRTAILSSLAVPAGCDREGAWRAPEGCHSLFVRIGGPSSLFERTGQT